MMTNKQNDNNTQSRGFASMDPKKQHEIASKGGHAAAGGDTSKRGFASMDEDKQHEIASKGGHAAAGGDTSHRGFASMDEDKKHEIQSKGGHASAEKAGHEGMAERGRKGGQASHGGQNNSENE
jgi:general stress protein YciG